MAGWQDLRLIGRLGITLTIPAVLAVGPLGGYAAGTWLDGRWRTAPWGLFGGLLLGSVASGVQVYRILRWIDSPKRP